MNKCPNCEYHKESARMWRQKAYTLSGHPLNDEPEPVAYKYTDKTNPLVFYFTERKGKDVTQNPDAIETALYTAPQQREWVGLTDEQIVKSVREIGWGQSYINWTEIIEFTRYIEAKLKEKNGG
jgi:hypothetical protein